MHVLIHRLFAVCTEQKGKGQWLNDGQHGVLSPADYTGVGHHVMKNRWFIFFGSLLVTLANAVFAQKTPDALAQQAQLPDCIQYALENQPTIRQLLIDQEIADRTVRSMLAAWYPQLGAGYSLTHFLKLSVTLIPDLATGERRPVALGAKNTSTVSFSLSQAVFNRDVLLASQTADAYRVQATQATVDTKIDVIVNVSKAFCIALK